MFPYVYMKLMYTFITNEQICIFLGKSNTFLCAHISHKLHKVFYFSLHLRRKYHVPILSLFWQSLVRRNLFFTMVSVITVLVYTDIVKVLKVFLSLNNFLASITPWLFIASFITQNVFLFFLSASCSSVKKVCLEEFSSATEVSKTF